MFRCFTLTTGLLLLLIVGCATYSSKVDVARRSLRSKDTAKAIKELEPLAAKPGNDQLVYLLDYATALQAAKRFKESNEVFHRADKVSEVKDYHSLSRITGSLLLSQEMVQYKGEPYEVVLINALSAINYLMLDQLDEALVEARRLNEKLTRYKNDAKKEYQQNVFARYLAAMAWESDGKFDDAYIDYKESYKLNPAIGLLKEDLVRVSYKARRMKDHKKWIKDFGVEYKKEWSNPTMGQIAVIFQQGWGPQKRANPESPRFPKLFKSWSYTSKAKVVIEGVGDKVTEEVYNVSDIAIKTFNDEMGSLIAKRMAGIVAKEVAADQIRQKNEFLGAVAWIAMHATDRADVRHWSTLPNGFQVARIWLPAGTYNVKVLGLNDSMAPTGDEMQTIKVLVRPRRISFVNWRSFN